MAKLTLEELTEIALAQDADRIHLIEDFPHRTALEMPLNPHIEGDKEMHIFAIGDWGGMDGFLKPIEGRPYVVAYSWGAKPGPSVFPRTRWNYYHTKELCSHKQFIACFNSKGGGHDCPASCGYVKGVDDQPQQLVASALRERSGLNAPDFLLNVGDPCGDATAATCGGQARRMGPSRLSHASRAPPQQ